jgi:hypothetical protein
LSGCVSIQCAAYSANVVLLPATNVPADSSASIFALNAMASSTVSPALRLNVLPVASRQS